jgi:SAM-dependent methyltransferase
VIDLPAGIELPHGGGRRHGRGCPAFTNPDEYLACREGWPLVAQVKRFFERRAIARCLGDLDHIESVADVPCGPGRLFPYWRRLGLTVVGVDCSAPMVAAATLCHRKAELRGQVLRGDAFRLKESLSETVDLVASVRFCYYFHRDQRTALLRALATASRRYVLVQYKTWETLRGRRNQRRTLSRHGADGKQYCSYAEMREEFRQAGLEGVRVEPIGPWSDRAFVMGWKA